MDRRQRMITGIESMDWNSQASPGSDRSTQAIQRSSNLVEGSMGQLVEWSLSPPEVRGSNPIGVIIENFSTRCYLCYLVKTEIKVDHCAEALIVLSILLSRVLILPLTRKK